MFDNWLFNIRIGLSFTWGLEFDDWTAGQLTGWIVWISVFVKFEYFQINNIVIFIIWYYIDIFQKVNENLILKIYCVLFEKNYSFFKVFKNLKHFIRHWFLTQSFINNINQLNSLINLNVLYILVEEWIDQAEYHYQR